ncbi:MAG: DUF1830 domain-containing protein [Symploca sp. SIO2B6]|nr:DUF1830 domain-containing protein [Symploca sp. SIO2B6]
MNQLLTPLPDYYTQKNLCCYVNGTTKVIVVRITNVPDWYFERVVFPDERFLFEAPSAAKLEIHQLTDTGTTISDIISCNYLRIEQKNSTSKLIESNPINSSQITSVS